LRKKLRRRYLRDAGSIIGLTGVREDFEIRTRVFYENLSKSKVLFPPSRFVKDIYRSNGYDDSNLEVLPLGITRPTQNTDTGTRPEHLTLGYVGTLIHSKGLHILLNAIQNLKGSPVRIKIYGRDDADPGYAKRVHRIIENDERISFEGPFEIEMRDKIYNQIDLLVIPSLAQETFSLVAREALIRGVPVIASKVGALPEIIQHGRNGFLYASGDSVALAKLVREVLDTPGLLDSLRLPGDEKILSIEDHLKQLTTAYKMVLSG
jgi:glycosyltransferase involved in cell wall biosynthesis